jgi:hypothetical protein
LQSILAEVRRAARQSPRLYAAPFVGAIRQTRFIVRQIERENRRFASAVDSRKDRSSA